MNSPAVLEQDRALRELWRPSRLEQMAAVEILLASSIPTELREMVRRFEQELACRKDIQ